MLGFVGPFGDSNYGDYAMFVNDVYSLKNSHIMVFSYNTNLINILKDKYLNSVNVECCQVDIEYSYKEKFTGAYHVEFDTRPYTPFEIISKVKNIDYLRKKISQIDYLIVCGGGYFNHIWNANHRKAKLFSILATIYIAAEEKKHIYFMGNTFGPFNESKLLFENFFNAIPANLVTYAVRDTVYSDKELKRLGVASDIVAVPDDLYFLDNSFSISFDVRKKKIKDKYIIWECYASMDEIKLNMETIRYFSNEMKRRYNLRVLFLPLDKRFGGEYQGKLICELDPQILFYDIDKEIIEVAELNYLVQNAELVVGHRYHLFLTSLVNNVPCVSVLKEVNGDYRYYYCKVKGLLDQVFENQIYFEDNFIRIDMWETLCFIVNNFGEIINAQKNVFNINKIAAEKKMKQKRDEYLQRIEKSII